MFTHIQQREEHICIYIYICIPKRNASRILYKHKRAKSNFAIGARASGINQSPNEIVRRTQCVLSNFTEAVLSALNRRVLIYAAGIFHCYDSLKRSYIRRSQSVGCE